MMSKKNYLCIENSDKILFPCGRTKFCDVINVSFHYTEKKNTNVVVVLVILTPASLYIELHFHSIIPTVQFGFLKFAFYFSFCYQFF